MKRCPPPDPGLKEPVRKLEDCFSIWDCILPHFFPDKYTQDKNGKAVLKQPKRH